RFKQMSVFLRFSPHVTKTYCSQTAGVEPPRPGKSIFHSTFFSASHSVGTFFAGLTPSKLGPRHTGQLSAKTVAASSTLPNNPPSNRRVIIHALQQSSSSPSRKIFPGLTPKCREIRAPNARQYTRGAGGLRASWQGAREPGRQRICR